MSAPAQDGGIAIVGMSGRFPGAPELGMFWRNLCDGVESITRFDVDDLDAGISAGLRAQPNYVAARAILHNVDEFDAGFFGITSRDADLIDPQHRLFLECCWEALEDAGCDASRYAGSIGVYAGCTINTYVLRNVLQGREAVERFTNEYQVGSYPELLGAGADFLATRVAYKLNLRGPAVTVQTACSTSLVAVAQACQALISRQADVMLAGAVSLSFPQKRGYLYQPGGMVSSDGHCRTFDVAASGTVFGDGAGVVVLKRIEDAVAERDFIYAVIRGVGVNNDGAAKAGYTAPSTAGQTAAIAAAHRMAGFDPRSIRYVECHGTATPLGDPIEFAALSRAFPAPDDGPYCTLGSVKTNIGHLDVAAGMSGLIKTALAIRNGKIPPVLHFSAPNPHVQLDGSAFSINATLTDWPSEDMHRRAGVSSFGVGGTNVHVVLDAPSARTANAETRPQLLVLSARSEAALANVQSRLADRLRATPDLDLADVAFTLQTGRRAFEHRISLTASTVTGAVDTLNRRLPASRAQGTPTVAFMFPGQGAQYGGMGRDLYARVPLFRETLERCASVINPLIGLDLRDLLYPPDPAAIDESKLAETGVAQPTLFAVEYALAQCWIHWGISPDVMIGHSIGEFVAATLAGVFRLDDALALVTERGRIMQSLPPGAMLAVRLSEAELRARLTPALDIAAVNSPKVAVAAGPFEAIEALERSVAAEGIAFRRLTTSHAFHSSMLDEALGPLLDCIRSIPLRAPQIPYVSGVSGDWITADSAASPEYWARHCREMIRFDAGVQTLIAGGVNAFVEVGPGSALAACVRQSRAPQAGLTITGSLREANREGNDVDVVLESLGKLWCIGSVPDWCAVHAPASPGRVSLPTYPFERRRHWIDEMPAVTPPAATLPALISPAAISPKLGMTPLTQAVPANPESTLSIDPQLESELIALLEDLSGETITTADRDTSFLELGLDSLFLGRFVQRLATAFGTAITFRALMTELPTVATLAEHISSTRPAPVVPAASETDPGTSVIASSPTPPAPRVQAALPQPNSIIETVVREQLAVMQQLMREQLQAIAGVSVPGAPAADLPVVTNVAGKTPSGTLMPSNGNPQSANGAPPSMTESAPVTEARPVSEPRRLVEPQPLSGSSPAIEARSRFDVYRAAGNVPRSELTAAQREHIDDLIERTVKQTPGSKARTARHRARLADPRVAAGFRSEWKEMVYPIVCDRAKGSKLWDVDGNEYIDVVNGFGQTAFGHAPDFVVEAVGAQLREGFPIGPQTPLAGEVAELFCELTGNERVTFCNTGSEAVMAALRVARTVTGRDRVVMFSGAYHGQFDEVLVKGARTSQRALPVAPGIPAESVANMVVLPYADEASLQWVREHATELAAVIVEPVQSRHPDLQPQEFLTQIRAITQASGTAFVIDEVVTGFRMHPGGMQALFGIRADLATYGKVVGGGMPIGILAGTARFMDALDGGDWRYGDDSVPQVPPTFFAGTFVRHPLVMAAVLAVLRHIKDQGPALQAALSARTAGLVAQINADLARRGIVSRVETYGSLFYVNFSGEERLAPLLYYHLRLRGIYIQDGFPCFITTAHTAHDIEAIATAFRESLDELQAVGIFGSSAPRATREFPLTEQQTEIWLAAQLGDDASCGFNESITLRLEGLLDESAFALAWDQIVGRHDALRAVFHPAGEHFRIDSAATLRYSRVDLSLHAEQTAQAEVAEFIALDAARPFDLVAGPLVRGHLLRLRADYHAFVFTAHHIICDGWSINVLLTEFAALYRTLRTGEPNKLAQPLAFSEYARAQRRRDPADLARVEAFWLAEFADGVPRLDLPTDRPRPAIRSFRGATHSIRIDAQRYRSVKKAGARLGCTLFVTLLSAFGTLVGRIAQTRDVVIGVPAAGQSLLDGDILVGHCVDFLPIRARWSDATTLAELLALMKTRVLGAYDHQDYTLGTLVRTLAPARGTNRVPLAEIQFNLERLADPPALPDLALTTAPNPKAFVNFDLFLNVIESDAGLRLDCDYNTDIFDAATIDRLLRAYDAVLEAIVADSSTPVGLVPIGAAATDDRVAAPIAVDAAIDYPRDATVAERISAQAALRPSATAAACGETTLTYAQLDARATALAKRLRNRFGGAGRIGICMKRSLDMLVALVAALKAGMPYVPLDPTHPPARLRYILNDAAVVAVIGDTTLDAAITPETIPVVHVAADINETDADVPDLHGTPPDAQALAYTIYTSGSTGMPKGVEITNRSLVNFLCSMAREPGFTSSDILLAVTTISFDIAGLELYLPLITGGTVVIADDAEARDGFRLHERLLRSQATVLQATPGTWRMLLETDFAPAAGFKMLCGGEALRRDLADRLVALGGELWNMYGPTETTIWSSCGRVAAGGPITVGRPIANTTFLILDELDRLAPAGTTGQLHIGGDGVARGYVNRDALTAEKFIANPFGAGRLYRTGDTARALPTGEFEILGRMDQQVKLRGYRIELGEIEATLTRHGAIAAAAVVLQESQQRLVAYYVARKDHPVAGDELRRLAQQLLPEYMVPAVWVKLDALPLNANGKVDRAALPVPATDPAAGFIVAQTPTERALAEIWADVLLRERISTDEDIFVLGADSIQIFQITARANRKGLPLLAKQLMKHRTIAAVAQTLDRDGPVGAAGASVSRLPLRAARPLVKSAGDRHFAPPA